MKILLVEDDVGLATTIRDELAHSYNVEIATTGEAGLRHARNESYDLIVLDISLPDRDGVSVCQAIRAKKIPTPILMLTAQQSVDKKVTALNEGADDYLTKPFSFAELTARLKALTRRPVSTFIHDKVSLGGLMIDRRRYEVQWQGQEIKLRRKEFLLLEYLARHAGQVVTRQMILDHVWDSNPRLFSNTVDVHINALRQKIDRPFDVDLIKTVPGIGYKLEV